MRPQDIKHTQEFIRANEHLVRHNGIMNWFLTDFQSCSDIHIHPGFGITAQTRGISTSQMKAIFGMRPPLPIKPEAKPIAKPKGRLKSQA